MEITIHNTDKMVELSGVPARVWEGRTKSGIAVHCFITRIAVERSQDCAEFELELEEQTVPCSEAWPARMIL